MDKCYVTSVVPCSVHPSQFSVTKRRKSNGVGLFQVSLVLKSASFVLSFVRFF